MCLQPCFANRLRWLCTQKKNAVEWPSRPSTYIHTALKLDYIWCCWPPSDHIYLHTHMPKTQIDVWRHSMQMDTHDLPPHVLYHDWTFLHACSSSALTLTQQSMEMHADIHYVYPGAVCTQLKCWEACMSQSHGKATWGMCTVSLRYILGYTWTMLLCAFW